MEGRTGECMEQSHPGNGYLIKKQNSRASARLQASLPLVLDSGFVLPPTIHMNLTIFLPIFPSKAPKGDRQGSAIRVKCQQDPATLPDNGGDLIKCNAMLDQLRSCVGRVEKYREDAQV